MFWCELTHPHELDVRRLPIEIRQQAIDEINRTVEKYSTKNNLALDTLKGYINSLVDNSYLFNKDKEIDVLEWHTEIESVLKKQKTFQELWPDLVSKLRK
jgi:hypothetical protein